MAKVTYDKKMRQVMLHSHKIEDIDGLTNPLRFQGEITTDFDSSIISGLDNGWFYTIKTTPSGQTVTDTNTGQVFKDKDEIAWDGAKWVIIGNESEIDSSKWANIDIQFDKGLLYNGFNSSMVDILPSGFFIPSLSVWNDLITIAGGPGTAGQRLKSLLGWTSVYPGDTNDLNFNATGTGVRVTAEFNGESQTTYFLASGTNGAEHDGVIFRYDVPNAIVLTAGAGGIPRTHGVSIRGVRSVTAEELLLADGASAGIVKDYDGNCYRTVKIGFNVWMADNLKTTHENDGTPLVQVQDQTAWAALTSPAYCYYNNTDIVVLDTIESNYIEPINNRKFSKSHIYDLIDFMDTSYFTALNEIIAIVNDGYVISTIHYVTNAEDSGSTIKICGNEISKLLQVSINGTILDTDSLTINVGDDGEIGNLPPLNEGEMIQILYYKYTSVGIDYLLDENHYVTTLEDGTSSVRITTESIAQLIQVARNGVLIDIESLTINVGADGNIGNFPMLNEGELIHVLYYKYVRIGNDYIKTTKHDVTNAEDGGNSITFSFDEITEILSIAIDGSIVDHSTIVLNNPSNGTISGLPVLSEGNFIQILYKSK